MQKMNNKCCKMTAEQANKIFWRFVWIDASVGALAGAAVDYCTYWPINVFTNSPNTPSGENTTNSSYFFSTNATNSTPTPGPANGTHPTIPPRVCDWRQPSLPDAGNGGIAAGIGAAAGGFFGAVVGATVVGTKWVVNGCKFDAPTEDENPLLEQPVKTQGCSPCCS